MTHTHTPAPWKVGTVKGKQVIYYTPTSHMAEGATNILATITKSKMRPDIMDANAALIAAAPDLLEALKGLVSAYQTLCAYHGLKYDLDPHSWCQAGQRAIAKAKVSA